MSLPNLHSPADLLASILVTAGLASTPTAPPLGNWPIYIDREPNAPDNVITLYDTTPKDDGDDSWDKTYHGGISLRVRSTTPDVGFVKAEALAVYINETINRPIVSIDGRTYRVENTDVVGWVNHIGKESPNSQRNVFTVNLMMTIVRLS